MALAGAAAGYWKGTFRFNCVGKGIGVQEVLDRPG
jgi:hypothetical protein